ncbi:MAG TPA: HEAT repeat domain-containing protein, partial [Chloroflexota bacterium]|nr:HEAT repeat domain-containing protein [Chloroflexota bacterium]
KSLQRSDWLHRPLALPLLAYAWRDAELTLALYHWAALEHPALLALHTSLYPRLTVPSGLPHWITLILEGSRQSAFDVLDQDDLDVDRDSDTVVSTMRQALELVNDPALRVRLFRVAAELDLFELVDELAASLKAPSANERAAAARALAALGELRAEPAIRGLLEDPTEEVRLAAAQALQTLPVRALELATGSPSSTNEG